jgi:hypothetical protein
VAEGADEDALDLFRRHGLPKALEALSQAFWPGALVNAAQDDFPASPSRMGGEVGKDLLSGLAAGVGGGGAGVQGN